MELLTLPGLCMASVKKKSSNFWDGFPRSSSLRAFTYEEAEEAFLLLLVPLTGSRICTPLGNKKRAQ